MSSSEAPYTFRQLESSVVAGAQRDMLSAALAEADAIREAARAEGEAAGHAAATAAVRAEAGETLHLLADAHTAIGDLRDELVAQLRGDCVTLALRLAEQILAATIEIEPGRLVDVAGQALRRLADRTTVTLVVHPAELEPLSGAVDRLRAELGGIEQLSVQADRRVGRGGVIARTREGEIDATVETQLARAREIVLAELAGPVAAG